MEAANPGAQAEVSANGDTTVTFPDGSKATLTGDKTVYVSENGELPDSIDLPKLIITKWVDENGNELKPTDAKAPVELGGANEALEHGEIEGYVFDRTVTDKVEGTVTHIFKRVKAEADTTAPTAPVVNTVKAGDTAVTGTAEAGSTVEVILPNGDKVSATADQDGNFSVPVSGLEEGQTVSVTATDEAGNKSDATTATVAKADDKTAPAKPVVDTDLTGKAGTRTPIDVIAEPGTKIELFDKDGNKIGEATADDNGKATIIPTVDIPEGTVTARATDPAGNVSDASDAAVATDTTAPAKPVVDTDLTGKAGTKTPVEVSAEPGSKVELFDKDGNQIGEATADENGKATITPTVDIPAGNVTAKATDPSGNVSDASDPMVATSTDTEAPAKPVVDTDLTGKAGTKTPVEVSAEPGSKVELFDKAGNKIGEATADTNGKATITPTVDIPAGNVTAKATDPSGNVSDASDPMVATSTDTEAPEKPVVNPVKAGDTAITGIAEAGSTVEVILPDGSKVSVKADQDGNFSVPVSGLEEGKTVSVTATDDAGNTSDAITATVAKATDTTAPDAPVVTTDLTGKAGTRTPIDVIAEPGSKVELFDKDGNKIGEATADATGHAVVVPTVNIPEGSVTAKATDLAGNVSGASAPMLATTSGTIDSFNNGKGSENTPTVVKPSLSGKVESSTTSAKRMNLKTRANISATKKDASTLPETGDEASIGGVVLGGILAAAGLAIAGKRRKED